MDILVAVLEHILPIVMGAGATVAMFDYNKDKGLFCISLIGCTVGATYAMLYM